MKTDLSTFNNDWYRPGAGRLKMGLWYLTNHLFINSYLLPFSAPKRGLLRLFGAKIGKGVVIKPKVNIKYPWRLRIDDQSWIGEGAWIDNLADVHIGAHCCVSQGALLLCGNHDYKQASFDLMVGEIKLEDGAWVGAKALVGPGVTLASHAVLSAGAVAYKDLETYAVYAGNPAVCVRERISIAKDA